MRDTFWGPAVCTCRSQSLFEAIVVGQIAWAVSVYSFTLHFPTNRDKLVCLAGVLCVTFECLPEYCLIVVLIVDIVIIVVIILSWFSSILQYWFLSQISRAVLVSGVDHLCQTFPAWGPLVSFETFHITWLAFSGTLRLHSRHIRGRNFKSTHFLTRVYMKVNVQHHALAALYPAPIE